MGDPGNSPDQLYTNNNPNNLRFAAVDYTYRISKYEVTNDQYTAFLNAVDPPTASNSLPTIATANAVGDISNPGTRVANYNRGADWNGQDGNVTTAGSAGAGSASFYSAFDQGGNVREWNEAVMDRNTSRRVLELRREPKV